MSRNTTLNLGSKKAILYNLELDFIERESLVNKIKPLWQQYEPWATAKEIRQTISKKRGRMLYLVYDTLGVLSGFSIFRIFQYDQLKFMFLGNSFYTEDVRGVGALLLRIVLRQHIPDRIVTFTPQERVYSFLKHFGKISPGDIEKLEPNERKVLTRLAGSKHFIDPNTSIISNFYAGKHKKQGSVLDDQNIRYLFDQLNECDSYALLIRCK